MSRPKRNLRKKFIVFCEGDTEYNYVEAMRLKQGVEISLKPVNMRGGGYASFLEEIKKSPNNNCLAKFIIIDFDRVKKHFGEQVKLKEMIEYCSVQNKGDKIPHFLIIDNPDFEYVACLHIPEYNGQDVKGYIENALGFGNVEIFKSKKNIYNFLNTNGNSYKLIFSKLNQKIVQNQYSINKRGLEIRIVDTKVDWDNANVKGSNIDEFFKIIDW